MTREVFGTDDRVVVVDVEQRDRDGDPQAALVQKLGRVLDQGFQCILLNLADVAYVDSVLLGAMVQGYTSAIRRGGTLKLQNASKRVRELLAVTRLDTVLKSVESEHPPAT